MNIIFHVPFVLDENSKSASGIRPIRMLKAFKSLGYQVDVVSGFSSERKSKILEIVKNIKNGKKYEFVYSESSTMPTALTDKDHIPRAPFLDFNFFNFLKLKNIPIGLFYRDIYWKFPNYGENLKTHKKILAKFFYKFDIFYYNKYIDVLYLPSLEMKKYIPDVKLKDIKALPPAHSIKDQKTEYVIHNSIKLLYVGGLSDHYTMHELFKAVNITDNVSLTICTREQEWELMKKEYMPYLDERIKIVHYFGEELEKLYHESNICMIFVKPTEYWTFASPVKFYEYIGAKKPIICSKNILIEKDILDNKIGWSIDYDAEELHKLLKYLAENIELIMEYEKNMVKVFHENHWNSRAKQVVQDLTLNRTP